MAPLVGRRNSYVSSAGSMAGGRYKSMWTFRIAITAAVLAFVTALASCLITIQIATSHAAAGAAAAAAMDAASANTLTRLKADVSELSSVARILATSPSLTDSDDRSEVDGAIGLFKSALHELPQADSLYVGYDNGCWLQVRRLDVLDATDDTQQRNRALVSPPYASFSIGTPMITLSAPLRGGVRGVLAADLKLDKFSDLVQAQRPGEHGTAVIFDAFGVLLAHPDFARLLEHARHHPSHPQMPQIDEIRTGLIGAVMRRWDGSDRYDGNISEEGQDYIFRLRKFSEDNAYSGYSLLIAAESDFAPTVRRLQSRGLVLALLACGCFMPVVWIFGSRMSRSLRRLTEQANQLHSLAAPDEKSVTSNISEIHELGSTLSVAQRTISSFAHFVPKDIVKGIIDGSISTELGGVRQEVTVLFTDVANFTGIAEASDPDNLMRQMSRHFTALTEAFIAEGGTVDKFIGDSVMVFWNAPHLQLDHVERACRAALVAKAASEALNIQFIAEGLQPFAVRLGIHFGDAVVGNLGSAERMEYTVLGNSVNLAARLEGLNKEYGTTILVSEAVRDRVHNRFHFNAIASVIAKGMTAETQVFELVEAVA